MRSHGSVVPYCVVTRTRKRAWCWPLCQTQPILIVPWWHSFLPWVNESGPSPRHRSHPSCCYACAVRLAQSITRTSINYHSRSASRCLSLKSRWKVRLVVCQESVDNAWKKNNFFFFFWSLLLLEVVLSLPFLISVFDFFFFFFTSSYFSFFLPPPQHTHHLLFYILLLLLLVSFFLFLPLITVILLDKAKRFLFPEVLVSMFPPLPRLKLYFLFILFFLFSLSEEQNISRLRARVT